MLIIIKRLTRSRIVNKDVAIIKVLQIFKENKYLRQHISKRERER